MHPEQYANRGMAGSVGSAAKLANVIERPRLIAQVDHIEKMLAECHAIASSLESAAERFLGPIPQEAGKAIPTPQTDTLERRLSEVTATIESLAQRLGGTSQRLNNAV